MSSSPANDLRIALNDVLAGVEPAEHVLSPVRRLAFWAAVALPFLYLPLLLTGLESATTVVAFLALLACNAAALLIGHRHNGD